ncbi:MAG: hypothetical protein KDA53_12585 [Hyphomonas sp.]|nr:hypothetical protein [Hyphomonas sp.]
MADRTNLPGALVVREPGANVTLSPPWRDVFLAAQGECGLTQADLIRAAAARHPELGKADATRLWIAEYFMTSRLPDRWRDLPVLFWAYEWKDHLRDEAA